MDTSGASIADAEVQISDSRTEALARKLSASTDGSFTATLLPPGTYYVLVNKAGFSQSRADNIEVRVTETTRITIALKPGEVSERVEISAQVTTVETTNATTGESMGTATIRELPLATQNYQQLLSLSSGTSSELNASAQLGRGNVRIIVNGQREDNNNYLIEGISSTDYNVAQSTNVPLPNPDVIQEFKVQTSLYDASQGPQWRRKCERDLAFWVQGFARRCLRIFSKRCFERQRVFPERSRRASSARKAEYFWSQPGWSGGEGKTGLLLRQLPGYEAA